MGRARRHKIDRQRQRHERAERARLEQSPSAVDRSAVQLRCSRCDEPKLMSAGVAGVTLSPSHVEQAVRSAGPFLCDSCDPEAHEEWYEDFFFAALAS